MHKLNAVLTCMILISLGLLNTANVVLAQDVSASGMQSWIQEMKEADKGPFNGIAWFCTNGSVRPARSPCPKDEFANQHGTLSERAETIRSAGYKIANVYASIKERDWDAFGTDPRKLVDLLLERFLVTYDDGWIFRRARFYRGALQVEDEDRAADDLIRYLGAQPQFRNQFYLLLREASRLFPRHASQELLTLIRARATQLSRGDRGFRTITNKIHSYPDAGDANRVREYAAARAKKGFAQQFEMLASLIDDFYQLPPLDNMLRDLAYKIPEDDVQERLLDLAARLQRAGSADAEFFVYADVMELLRDAVADGEFDSSTVIAILDVSNAVERVIFANREALIGQWKSRTREQHLHFLKEYTKVLYGTGLLSRRAYGAARAALDRVRDGGDPTPDEYLNELQHLALVPGWAMGQIDWAFSEGIARLATIEPLVNDYVPDRLRTSPLLFFSEQMNFLLSDAGRLVGLEHQFFGKTVHAGLRALNPGLGRGSLVAYPEGHALDALTSSNIVLVPATIPELRPVAGIFTAQEGNALSHVQLLARNLGIPNVVIEDNLLPALNGRNHARLVLAVSPKGRVEIADDGERWRSIFSKESKDNDIEIEPDLGKLDLDVKEVLSLRAVRKGQSGRTVGPKAAKVGELKAFYPGAVTEGVVLPFGLFAEALESTQRDGMPLLQWMKAQYRSLEELKKNPAAYQARVKEVLEKIRESILSIQFGPDFRAELRAAFERDIGDPDRIGVFVRSDTNIEDLPNFTGAGLNLTVPNVVGFENVIQAIREVWASPFTERSFSWRQSLMTDPEHVYVSVLLLRTVPVEKSGVLITSDVKTGDKDYFTVAVNEGVGGAVNNQKAETLLVHRPTASIRLLSEASTTRKRVANPEGGMQDVYTDRSEQILTPDEITVLYRFVNQLPEKLEDLPEVQDEDGVADIEFGFLNGKMVLFQIRPFLESRKAKESNYLAKMDEKKGNKDEFQSQSSGFFRQRIVE